MILHNKFLLTAQALKEWSKSTFGNARMQLHIVNEVILRMDIAQEHRQLSAAEQTLYQNLKLHFLG